MKPLKQRLRLNTSSYGIMLKSEEGMVAEEDTSKQAIVLL